MLTILFAFFFILLFLNLPVAFSIGLSSMIALCFYGDLPLSAIVTRMYSGVDSFTLLAIPFFIAAGEIMNESGITDKIAAEITTPQIDPIPPTITIAKTFARLNLKGNVIIA